MELHCDTVMETAVLGDQALRQLLLSAPRGPDGKVHITFDLPVHAGLARALQNAMRRLRELAVLEAVDVVLDCGTDTASAVAALAAGYGVEQLRASPDVLSQAYMLAGVASDG